MSLLTRLFYWRVQASLAPDDFSELGIDPALPVVYVLDTDSSISRTILKKELTRRGLPYDRFDETLKGVPAVMANKRLKGLWQRRPEYRTFENNLKDLMQRLAERPELKVQLVPVSVFLGRAPQKESGIFKILFSEQWGIASRFRRFMSLLVHGKHTLIRFSKPIVLDQALIKQEQPEEKLARKISRVLRVHFYRLRTSVVGPDLSHRRTVARSILNRPVVRQEIQRYARRKGISEEKAYAEANKIIREIAADYSYSVIRLLHLFLTWFWNKVYDGIHLNHFEEFRAKAPDYEVIYTPCHRSHIDYLILSYALYKRGFVPPHIAAGINLNLPVVGSLMRRGGAFFLRRSFNSALYATIFSEYLSALLTRGVSIEYFIEGTRSRTGRLLQPKAGMLAMTVRSYINDRSKPLMFQPIHLNYEKLMEGASYSQELGGKGKQRETLGGLLKARKVLKDEYGKLTVNFGQSINLDAYLDKHRPDWKKLTLAHNEKPEWFKQVVSEVSHDIMTRINQSAHVNAVNLLALALLSTPNRAADEDNLQAQLALYRQLLQQLPYDEKVTVTEETPAAMIERGIKLGFLERHAHDLGDVIRVRPGQGVLLTYYRNNILHLFAASSFIAMCFVNQRQFPRRELLRLMRDIYPFVKDELFLKWTREEFVDYGRQTIKLLHRLDLLKSAGRTLERHPGGSLQAGKLRVLAEGLMQTYERFFIVISVLKTQGSGTLTSAQLENLCHKTAEKLSLLYEFNSPDFFDKSLFKLFIKNLKAQDIIRTDEQGKITFTRNLEPIFEGAKKILSRRIRHSVLYLLPPPEAIQAKLETPVAEAEKPGSPALKGGKPEEAPSKPERPPTDGKPQ